jgi:hypothetical protein
MSNSTKTAKMNLDRAISIAVDGVWAGSGVLRDGEIADCAAVLGGSQEESDRIYDAIQSAIEDGDDSMDDEGKTYTWTLGEERPH